jgi:hypothetical protein
MRAILEGEPFFVRVRKTREDRANLLEQVQIDHLMYVMIHKFFDDVE